MAKLMPSGRQRDEYLHLADRDIEEALRATEDDPSGYLAIRGHIRLRQGRPDEALQDFQRVNTLKEAAGDARGIGEAKADIALVQMQRGSARQAVELLREGVAALEHAKSIPFAIRVRKRLALALLRSGHPFQAMRELSAAHESALTHQVYDQITPTMELVNRLTNILGLRKN
jgi:tetratricopeptide (TPR) repeat protein